MSEPRTEPRTPASAATAGTDSVCVFEWDCTLDELRASPGYLELVGGLPGEPPHRGNALLSRLSASDRERLLALRAGLTPDAPTYTTRWCIDAPGGGELLIEERACGFFTPDGQLKRIVGSVWSRPEPLVAALPQSEQLYRAIGESIDYGVWVCTPDGRNVYASDSFLELVGITQEQCSDFGWGSVLHPDDAGRTIAALSVGPGDFRASLEAALGAASARA